MAPRSSSNTSPARIPLTRSLSHTTLQPSSTRPRVPFGRLLSADAGTEYRQIILLRVASSRFVQRFVQKSVLEMDTQSIERFFLLPFFQSSPSQRNLQPELARYRTLSSTREMKVYVGLLIASAKKSPTPRSRNNLSTNTGCTLHFAAYRRSAPFPGSQTTRPGRN